MSVFTLMDHWFQMEIMATSEDPMLEGYTSLDALSGGRAQLGTCGDHLLTTADQPDGA